MSIFRVRNSFFELGVINIIETENNQIDEKDNIEYEFRPDSDIKDLLSALSSEELIPILNEIAKTDFPITYKAVFGNTESFDATGSNEKGKIIGDNLIIITTADGSEILDKNFPMSNKIAFELQSTKYTDSHYSMGFRMFLYCINAVDRVNFEDEYVYNVPYGITIYTEEKLPKFGVDKFIMNYPSFWVGEKQYQGKKGEYCRIEYPYVNLLAFDLKEFEGTPFEVFQVLFMYRYRKNINLMLVEDFTISMKSIANKILKFEGKVLEVLTRIYQNLIRDIMSKAQTDANKYGKVIEDMEKVRISYGERLVTEAIAKGEAIGEARGIAKGEARGIAKGEVKAQLKMSKILGIPLEQLQEMMSKNTPLEEPPVI